MNGDSPEKIAEDFKNYVGSDDPQYISQIGDDLRKRIEALIKDAKEDAWKYRSLCK